LKSTPTDVIDIAAPKFIVAHGRGGTGKSTFVRIIAERAQAAGRDVIIADADRTNATLGNFFSGVIRPEYPDDRSVMDWLDDLVNGIADAKQTVLLDLGGGDNVFKPFAAGLELANLLTSAGIMPVAMHFMGPDIDDLSYLATIETANAFCPSQTILVKNEGLIKDARPRDVAFSNVVKHDIYRAAVKRGAREVWLPRLACMPEISSGRMLFSVAETKLGLTDRQRVAIWRRAVEKELAPVVDWLP
jgi:hypothetical protein